MNYTSPNKKLLDIGGIVHRRLEDDEFDEEEDEEPDDSYLLDGEDDEEPNDEGNIANEQIIDGVPNTAQRVEKLMLYSGIVAVILGICIFAYTVVRKNKIRRI